MADSAETLSGGGLTNEPTSHLMALIRNAFDELGRRGVMKPNRALVAQFGEWLVGEYLRRRGHNLRPGGHKWDFVTETGERIEVKTIQTGDAKRAPAVLLRSLDFDRLAVVVFDDSLEPITALLMPRERAEAHAKRHHDGWTIRMTPAVSVDRAVMDLTAEVRRLAHLAK